MRQLPDNVIRAGRDRVSEVLEPLIGEAAALERANNIVQALVFGASDPARVAIDMLRHSGLKDAPAVAAKVDRAWRQGIIRRPRSARINSDA